MAIIISFGFLACLSINSNAADSTVLSHGNIVLKQQDLNTSTLEIYACDIQYLKDEIDNLKAQLN